MDTQELWQTALGELELQLSKADFTTWFKDTFISEITRDKVVIAVPNNFTKTWFENKYHRDILKSIQRATSNAVREVCYKVEVHTSAPVAKAVPVQEAPVAHTFEPTYQYRAPEGYAGDSLNPRYTFSQYIVGKQNEFAHAAALAVPKHLGNTYNPFTEGSALKTHLYRPWLRCRLHPGRRVLYDR